MPSGHNKPRLDPDTLHVLVICLEDKEALVRQLLGKLCRANWEERGGVGILSIPRSARDVTPRLTRWLDLFVRPGQFCQVFFQRGIGIPVEARASGQLRSQIPYRRVEELALLLPPVLQPLRLDWLSDVTDTLQGHWVHGTGGIDRSRLEKWLKQFERLGESWIGQGLLKSLDFWSTDRQRQAIGISTEFLKNYSRICVNRKRPGKSGDFLANILRKQIAGLDANYPEVIDFWELFSNGEITKTPGNLVLIEDGLFTGTETTNFISGLLGLSHPSGRKWTTPSLPNPESMYSQPIILKYAVATSVGIEVTTSFLKSNGLSNVSIDTFGSGRHIDNLTQAGKEALAAGNFFIPGKHKILTNIDGHLTSPVFSNLYVWQTQERATRARNFCDAIGSQLFRQYVTWKGWKWDEERLAMCGLGMNGFGLAVAFSQSVPKASLPVFWMDGRVRIGPRELDWLPLFPDGKV